MLVDVTPEETAQQIADRIPDAADEEFVLRVVAKRGASRWMAKLFGGASEISRAARGSALVARGYGQIRGEIDAEGNDVVRGS